MLGVVSLSQPGHRELGPCVLALLSFLFATGLGQVFRLRFTPPSSLWLWITIGLESVLILLSPLPFLCHLQDAVAPFVLCLCVALGLQNGAFNSAGPYDAHTTYMTGMATTLLGSLLKRRMSQAGGKALQNTGQKAEMIAWVLLAFTVGATCGGWMELRVGPRALWLLEAPLALVVFLVWRGTVG